MPSVSRQTLPFSVVIIARNEERRIGGCIDSVSGLTDDVILVDSFSTDATVEIARAKGARVFQRRWEGYSEQKNFGNAHARYDWILSLDADERVSPKLAAALRGVFAPTPQHDIYDLPFQNFFGDRRIRFGAWNPESHARLFDRRLFEWNTDSIHEGLCGPAEFRRSRLAGSILHFTVEDRAHFAAKIDRYCDLFAAKLRESGKQPGWAKVWLNPLWRFARDYIVRFGMLDGRAGLVIAWEGARYTHLKYRRAQTHPARRPLASWLALGAAAAMLALAATQISAPFSRTHSAGSSLTIGASAGSADTNVSQLRALNGPDDDNSTLDTLQDDDDVIA